MIRKSRKINQKKDRKINYKRGGDPRGPPGPQPPLLFLIFLSFVWFLFLDFLIILFDFVDFLIDVHGLGDVRFGFGPVPVPAGSGSVRFRFSRFRRLVYLSANFEMHNLARVFLCLFSFPMVWEHLDPF